MAVLASTPMRSRRHTRHMIAAACCCLVGLVSGLAIAFTLTSGTEEHPINQDEPLKR